MKVLQTIWNGIKLVGVVVAVALGVTITTALAIAGVAVAVAVWVVSRPFVWAGAAIASLFSSSAVA